MKNDDFSKSLSPQNPAQYASFNKDYLLAYSISLMLENRVPTTFETIVVTIFKLFPESFSLIGFPEYPDAARINRTLLHARPNYQNLVLGDAKRGYKLTKKGELRAQEITRALSAPATSSTPAASASNEEKRTYKGTEHIARVETSALFKAWQDGKTDEISPYEFWFFLDVSPTTDRDTLNHIIEDFEKAAVLGARDDITKFIGWVKRKYNAQLNRDK